MVRRHGRQWRMFITVKVGLRSTISVTCGEYLVNSLFQLMGEAPDMETLMPYVTITASQGFSAEQKKKLLEQASDAVVQSIGAPKATVRVLLHELSAGNYLNADRFDSKALMFEVDMITGRSEELKAALIAQLSRIGYETTGVPESEIRVRVTDFPRENMGMAGGITAKTAAR